MIQLLDAAAVEQWKLDYTRQLQHDENSGSVFGYYKDDADEFLAKLVAELESERRITVAMADSLGETVEILGGDEHDLAPHVAREVIAQRDGMLAALKAIVFAVKPDQNDDSPHHGDAYHLASQAIADFDPDPELADAIGGLVELPTPNLSQNMNATYDAAYAHGFKDGEAKALAGMVRMGVGTGDGNLFVYGDYDSIKAAQAIVLECERLRAAVANLESAWQVETMTRKDQLIANQEAENDRVKAELQKKDTCIENCMAVEADLRAELEKRTDQLAEMRADRNDLFAKLQAAKEQPPIGTFTGKFYGDVNGRSFFEVKCFDALPTAGAYVYIGEASALESVYTLPIGTKLYREPVPAMPVEVTDDMAQAFKVAFNDHGSREDYMADIKLGLSAALGARIAAPIPKQEPVGKMMVSKSKGSGICYDFSWIKSPETGEIMASYLSDGIYNCYAYPQPAQAAAIPDELPVHVLDAVSEALGDCYDCMRTWNAWAHGTMRQGDFVEVRESAERVEEIARAAITAYVAGQQGVTAQQTIELAYREGWASGWAERHTSLNNDSRVTPWQVPKADQDRDWLESDAKKHCEPEVAAPVADPDNVWERAVIEAAEAVVRANQNDTGNEPSHSLVMMRIDELVQILADNQVNYQPSPAVAVPNRELLRAIVDKAWSEATESQNVPSTKWADQIIDSVVLSAPSDKSAVAAHDSSGLLPLSPHDHPDCQAMVWSESEIVAIKEYASRCIAAANQPEAEKSPVVGDYITGDCYEAGLWSRRNIEAFVRDGNTLGCAKQLPDVCAYMLIDDRRSGKSSPTYIAPSEVEPYKLMLDKGFRMFPVGVIGDEIIASTPKPDRTGMYFYKVDSCKAKDPGSHDCICWHKIGTGPLPNVQPDHGGAS